MRCGWSIRGRRVGERVCGTLGRVSGTQGMAFDASKLQRSSLGKGPSQVVTSDVESAEDEDRKQKIKWIVILVLIGIIIALIIGGAIASMGKSGGSGGASAVVTPPQPTPPPKPEGAARLVVTITPTDPLGNRLTFGNKLPWPVPSEGQVDIDGGMLQGGQQSWAKDTRTSTGTTLLFEPDQDEVWVRVEIAASTRTSLLGKSVDAAERVVPPYLLVDGKQCGALGFLYEDALTRSFLLEPMLGMRGLAQAPTLQQQRNDQTMWLVFRAPKGGYLKSLWYGRKKVMEWDPPVLVPAQ